MGDGVNVASLVFGLICFCVPYRRDYKYISPKNIHFNERSDVSSRMSGLTFWAWSGGAFRSVKNKKLFERSEFFLFIAEKYRSSSKNAAGEFYSDTILINSSFRSFSFVRAKENERIQYLHCNSLKISFGWTSSRWTSTSSPYIYRTTFIVCHTIIRRVPYHEP